MEGRFVYVCISLISPTSCLLMNWLMMFPEQRRQGDKEEEEEKEEVHDSNDMQ